MKNPKITVLMPVYNGEKYLGESIDSILNQKFKDFEFLIIDDGSTDGSREIIRQHKDERIIFLENEKNIGLVGTLNKGLAISKGEYIARMDQDDISLPEKLAKQVELMDSNPEVGICGTWIKLFGDAQGTIKHPTENDKIKCHLLFYNPLAHPTVIIRSSFLKKFNLTYEENAAEDYVLWQKCAQLFKIRNVPKVLLMYRISSKSYTQTYKTKMGKTLNEIYRKKLLELKVEKINENLLEIHKRIGNKMPLEKESDVQRAVEHLCNLRKNNNQLSIYPTKEFDKIINELFLTSCLGAPISRAKKIKFIVFFPFILNAFSSINKEGVASLVKIITKKWFLKKY